MYFRERKRNHFLLTSQTDKAQTSWERSTLLEAQVAFYLYLLLLGVRKRFIIYES